MNMIKNFLNLIMVVGSDKYKQYCENKQKLNNYLIEMIERKEKINNSDFRGIQKDIDDYIEVLKKYNKLILYTEEPSLIIGSTHIEIVKNYQQLLEEFLNIPEPYLGWDDY